MKSFVRLLQIELEQFKNVEYGKLEMKSRQTAKKEAQGAKEDVIGIYGQNGSGKTALVEALEVWKRVMQGKELSENLRRLLKEETTIRLSFLVKKEEDIFYMEHVLTLECDKPKCIVEESFVCRKWEEGKWNRKRKADDSLIHMLRRYAASGLWIITTEQLGRINLNMGTAIDFAMNQENGIPSEEQRVSLFEENEVPRDEMGKIRRLAEQLNIVLQAILPGLQVLIEEEDGECTKFRFLANRYGITFPLASESGGLKRIISILSILIAGYNSASVCVVIDEADAGIFEFLLGELLEILRDGGKGQFIFTSHNLRALEVLGKSHIYFSTANPQNRYIQFSSLKKNQNLRDAYLRSILLGGQKESVYQDENAYSIGYAFRKAGKLYEQN